MDPIQRAHARADWRRVEQLYAQFSGIANDPEKSNPLPDDVAGALAESLGRLIAHYDGLERDFMDDLLCVWSDIDHLGGSLRDQFRHLYLDPRLERFTEYHPLGEGRRRPKPFESSIETSRRLIDLNHVRDALSSLPTGGILGGSLSYGRFFNVAGAITAKPSDTDLLLVIPDYNTLNQIPIALRSAEGVDLESLEQLAERVDRFHKIRQSLHPCILSHKLKFWEDRDPHLDQYGLSGQYVLSIHAFSRSDFEYLILKDQPVLKADASGPFVRDLNDYRDSEPTRRDNLRAYSGLDYSMELDFTKAELGYMNRVRVCRIEDERYCPGLHQNIILPQFEIRWQSHSSRLYLPLLGFRWKMLERLSEERRLRPFEIQNLALSHTRYAVFSPHIKRRASRE